MTTATQAQQTATATPNSIIQIESGLSGGISVSAGNTSLTFQGDPVLGHVAVNSAGGIVSTATIPVTFKSLSVITSAVNANVQSTAGSKITFLDDWFSGTSSSTFIELTAIYTNAPAIYMDRCLIDGGSTGAYGIYCNQIEARAGAVSVLDTVIKNCSGQAAVVTSQSSVTACFNFLNCDFVNNNGGVSQGSTTAGGNWTNCLFLGNTTDIESNSTALSDFTYCGFGQQASGGGTGCIYGLTKGREWCDQSNLYMSPVALCRKAGTSISGLTNTLAGFNNVLQGFDGIDIGAKPYSPALCPGLGSGK